MESHMPLPPLPLDGDLDIKQKDNQPQHQRNHQPHQQLLADPSLYNKVSSSLPPPPPPPPTYSPPTTIQAHDILSSHFSENATAALAPIKPRSSQTDRAINTLPSLASLTGSSPQPYSSPRVRESATYSPPLRQTDSWPSLNPLTAYYAPSHAQAADSPNRMDLDVSSMGAVSAASPDRNLDGRASSVTLDDPDVRMAAEALGDLRADFVSSPPSHNTPRPRATPPSRSPSQRSPQPEPLFALLTTSHPLLATTIEGATSVYTNSKNFSPRFKSGAEYVEGYLTPIANTMGSVSRVTGVEGGVRWFLGAGRRPHPSNTDVEAAQLGPNKRRKIDGIEGAEDHAAGEVGDYGQTLPGQQTVSGDPYAFTKERRSSMSTVDTLPAYDDMRSPAYEATDGQERNRTPTADQQPSNSSAWQSRLIMSTSGLSIAMSEESLRSLKYCLRWLRWANDHIGNVVNTLKTTLDQYDGRSAQAQAEPSSFTAPSSQDHLMADADALYSAERQPEISVASQTEMAGRIAAMRNDVLKTLRDVIETVSKYAGGALPDNARVLVRKHLTSLPQRFRLASQMDSSDSEAGKQQADDSEKGSHEREKEVREGAQRVLLLAKEGLDMMAQVSGVLDGTIVSAEEWCERLGRRKREERPSQGANSPSASGDALALPAPPTPTVERLTGLSVDGDVKMT